MGEGKILSRRWTIRAAAALTIAAGSVAAAPSAAAPLCLGMTETGRIAGVEDARTIRLDDGRALRLAGIEPIAALFADSVVAEAAMAVLVRRLQAVGGPVRFRLVAGEPDRYGRFPAIVESNGILIQELLAGEGMAVAFALGASVPCFDRFLAAEEEARRQGRGFWADAAIPFAVPDNLEGRAGLLTIFEGNVLTVGNRPSRTYLNFGRRWSEDVTVEIPAADRDIFGGEEGLSQMAGRRVRVRGMLANRNGPLVTAHSPMQVEILPQTSGPGPRSGQIGGGTP